MLPCYCMELQYAQPNLKEQRKPAFKGRAYNSLLAYICQSAVHTLVYNSKYPIQYKILYSLRGLNTLFRYSLLTYV